MKGLAVAVAFLAALALTARADGSLGDAARRERERRAASARSTARAYTDADLAASRSSSGPRPEAPPPTPSPAPSPEAASREAAERAALERAWRQRFAEARQRLWEADARAYETVVEPVLVGDGRKGVWVPMQVRRKIETEELRQARRALADLEEELRVAGLPPGWGRE
ncbi:MAG TPA: hypothetical protein VFM88_01325 [Vicinamibacteria bacterium]|nr:hypothetical protein [Vicinamibacteria bacterium]